MNGKFTSRKFWLVAGIVLLCGAAVASGKAEFAEATAVAMAIVGPYLGLNVAEKAHNGNKPPSS